MENIPNYRIANILQEYRVKVEPESPLIGGIRTYIGLLLRWNRSVSLTAVTDPEEIVRFHFGESMFAAPIAGITGGRLADVGSGAGFPGIPLKMLVPEIDLALIESNAKKAAFLSEVVRELQLENVTVARSRMEEFRGQFDFVTARALGHFEQLLAWSRKSLTAEGNVVLWIGEEDLKAVTGMAGWQWAPEVRIPGSTRRFILVGTAAAA